MIQVDKLQPRQDNKKCIVEGEIGLKEFCQFVRLAWADGRSFTIDVLTEFLPDKAVWQTNATKH